MKYHDNELNGPLDRIVGAEMGHALSAWYFGDGLLLSVEARDAYFKLARALTRASLAKSLNVPTFPDDGEEISLEKLRCYREELKKMKLDFLNVENWIFGRHTSETEATARTLHLRFKDYVFLQFLTGTLRNRLSTQPAASVAESLNSSL